MNFDFLMRHAIYWEPDQIISILPELYLCQKKKSNLMRIHNESRRRTNLRMHLILKLESTVISWLCGQKENYSQRVLETLRPKKLAQSSAVETEKAIIPILCLHLYFIKENKPQAKSTVG